MGLFFSKNKAKAYVIEESPLAQPVTSAHLTVAGSRARLAQRSRKRIGMCAVVFFAAFLTLGARVSYIALGGSPGAASAPAFADAQDRLRPDMLDRNGKIFATNLPVIALEVAGAEVWDARETSARLGEILSDIDAEALRAKLENGRYVEVSPSLTPAQQDAVFNLGLPGVRFSPRAKRYYPQGDLAAHIVGHTEPGKGGVMGLEAYLDQTGGAAPLVTSIDVRAQQALERELDAAIKKFHAKAGWAGVMDVTTGEVIALASLPDFDPNAPGAVEADWRRNRATYDRYELGSAFKAITAAAALEAGVAREGATYDARGNYMVADRTIHDFHGENRVLTLSEVVQHSSNIGIVQVAEDLGVASQKMYLEALGLFDPLAIELPENRSPDLPWQWGPVEAATVSYGHGISVTPLHLLSAFCAVVNGGAYRPPTFLKVDAARDGAQVFSPETSAVMRRILRRVLTNGTASFADVEGYFPIGKTATADKPVRGGYDRSTRIASFIGAFPGYAPRYAVLVSLDEPQVIKETMGYATAGWNAAPTFARTVERLAPILGVMAVSENEALAAFFEPQQVTQAGDKHGAGAAMDGAR